MLSENEKGKKIKRFDKITYESAAGFNFNKLE